MSITAYLRAAQRRLKPVAAVCLAAVCLAAWSDEEQRARQLLRAGRAAEAASIYRQLAQADASNPNLLLDLTIALYQAKDYRGAIENATEALRRAPAMLPARLFLGASHLELGEYAQAIAALDLVVAANPNERNGRLMLGKALLAAGQPGRAVGQLQAATQLLPANASAWYGLGQALAQLGQKDAAQDAWQHLKGLPPSPEAHRHAAEVNVADGRWREAALDWQAALRMAPDDAVLRMGLAEALYRSRDYQAAMAALQPLLPGQLAAAMFLYGGSLLNLQQPAEAIPYLRAARARDPHLLPACAALGQALLQTGKPEQAIPLLLQARPVDSDGSLHFQLFRAYQLTHRQAEARHALGEYQRLRAAAY